MRLIKHISFLVLFLNTLTNSFAQGPVIPQPVCPGEKGLVYYTNPSYSGSSFIWEITGGIYNQADGNRLDSIITVDWQERSDITSYKLRVKEVYYGCEGEWVEVEIGFKPFSKVMLLDGKDKITICSDATPYRMSVQPGFSFVEWMDGTRSNTFYVYQTGRVWVNTISAEGCESSDTVWVTVVDKPVLNLPDEYQLCNDTVFNPGDFLSYKWSTGEETQFYNVDMDIEPMDLGVYVVDYDSVCFITDTVRLLACDERIEIPNIFTPGDNDEANRYWKIRRIENYPNALVQVYDRRGRLIYTSKGNYVPWDGTYKGRPMPTDSYHYFIVLNDANNTPPYRGTISIIR